MNLLKQTWSHPDFGKPIFDGQRHERYPIPDELRKAVYQRDRYTCGICLRVSSKYDEIVMQADHLLPVAAGGGDRSDNLWTLCERCNAEKSNIFTIEVRSVRPRLIVAVCHNEVPLPDDVEFYSARLVFCAHCKHRATVDANHAEKYELSEWLSRYGSHAAS